MKARWLLVTVALLLASTPASAEDEPFVYHRRNMSDEKQLLRHLAKVPEVMLDSSSGFRKTREVLDKFDSLEGINKESLDLRANFRETLSERNYLPWVAKERIQLTKEAEGHFASYLTWLRADWNLTNKQRKGTFGQSFGDFSNRPFQPIPHPEPQALRHMFRPTDPAADVWKKSEAIPALRHLLPVENEEIRLIYVEQLERILGKDSSGELARLAVYDPSAKVRESALKVLADRPKDGLRSRFVEGLRHPWQAVVDHSAEAIASLEMADLVPQLVAMLDEPDPLEPFPNRKVGRWVVRELVRVDHQKNCLLCHPATFSSKPKVRGGIPLPPRPIRPRPVQPQLNVPSGPPVFPGSLPPSGGFDGFRGIGGLGQQTGFLPPSGGLDGFDGYGGFGGQSAVPEFFIRADITYLRPDFSVTLPTAREGDRRFDFVVRERRAMYKDHPRRRKPGEVRPPSKRQKAIMFALRKVTHRDPGPTVADWKRLFPPKPDSPK